MQGDTRFEMQIKGPKGAVEGFLGLLKGEGPAGEQLSFAAADLAVLAMSEMDDACICRVEGTIAGSIHSAGIEPVQPMDAAKTLPQASAEGGLEFECYTENDALHFAEHIVVRHGAVAVDEDAPFYWYHADSADGYDDYCVWFDEMIQDAPGSAEKMHPDAFAACAQVGEILVYGGYEKRYTGAPENPNDAAWLDPARRYRDNAGPGTRSDAARSAAYREAPLRPADGFAPYIDAVERNFGTIFPDAHYAGWKLRGVSDSDADIRFEQGELEGALSLSYAPVGQSAGGSGAPCAVVISCMQTTRATQEEVAGESPDSALSLSCTLVDRSSNLGDVDAWVGELSARQTGNHLSAD